MDFLFYLFVYFFKMDFLLIYLSYMVYKLMGTKFKYVQQLIKSNGNFLEHIFDVIDVF